jgi:ankyrin repeat protein
MSLDNLKKLLSKIGELPAFESLPHLSATSKTSVGETPLHVAASWGDLDAIKLLVDAGADLSARGDLGYTPLHEAAEQGHANAVALLIKLGARINMTQDQGLTASDLAKLMGNESVKPVFDHFNSRRD